MNFEKSNYQRHFTNKAITVNVGNKKEGYGGTFRHFPNARKGKTKYSSFGDNEKLKAEGKY